jgi:starvation-inducible DNA-binding protein
MVTNPARNTGSMLCRTLAAAIGIRAARGALLDATRFPDTEQDGGTMAKAMDTGINTRDRAAIAKGLSRLLADTYVVYLKSHNFHWNVEGPMFQTLHQMFMEQYTEAWNAVDLIAERIRSLGHYAPGTYGQYLSLSRVKETPGVPKAEKMVQILIEGQESVVRTAREVLPIAAKADDQPTLDLLTQRMQVHEKNAWMLRSLLKK